MTTQPALRRRRIFNHDEGGTTTTSSSNTDDTAATTTATTTLSSSSSSTNSSSNLSNNSNDNSTTTATTTKATTTTTAEASYDNNYGKTQTKMTMIKPTIDTDPRIVVSFQAKPIIIGTGNNKCPFGNTVVDIQLYQDGDCCWLKGNSGVGKTTLSMYLAGLLSDADLAKLDESHYVPTTERRQLPSTSSIIQASVDLNLTNLSPSICLQLSTD